MFGQWGLCAWGLALAMLPVDSQAQVVGHVDFLPRLSLGVGVFNFYGAVDERGYNHTPPEINAEYFSGAKRMLKKSVV